MWNREEALHSNEDCLFLNVFTPKRTSKDKLPVMVWIHGGAFIGGAGNGLYYAPRRLTDAGVIVVSFNYRLGPFGFFAHPELSAARPEHSSGNYGLSDAMAALQWIQANIRQFGGDPQNVTIFGQSAGGSMVMNLLISPVTHGLFARAIIESGASFALPTISRSDAEAEGERFANGRSITELRSLPAADILNQFGAFALKSQIRSGPIIDGYLLIETPLEALKLQHEQQVPLIIGNNADEGLGKLAPEDLPYAVGKAYGSNAPQALLLYQAEDASHNADVSQRNSTQQFLTDTSFRCGAAITARLHTLAGAPVWEYQFEQSLPGRSSEGAAHSYEIPYVFGALLSEGVLGARFGPADHLLSDTMIRAWTNFAKTGNPNYLSHTLWPQFTSSKHEYIRFSSEFPGSALADRNLRDGFCALYGQK
jgi:para-nitrobenzyl esterase